VVLMEISPDSIIEVDCHMDGEKMYFHHFFCALGPCTQSFREVCRPYLSVDSTRLNGKWCGQLVVACGVDEQNWMYRSLSDAELDVPGRFQIFWHQDAG
jgi:hypothetical protein